MRHRNPRKEGLKTDFPKIPVTISGTDAMLGLVVRKEPWRYISA